MSDGGGSGITTMAVLQSLGQARVRWGQEAAGAIWDAAIVKAILGGSANADDLVGLSRLIGDRLVKEHSKTTSGWGRRGRCRPRCATDRSWSRPISAASGWASAAAVVFGAAHDDDVVALDGPPGCAPAHRGASAVRAGHPFRQGRELVWAAASMRDTVARYWLVTAAAGLSGGLRQLDGQPSVAGWRRGWRVRWVAYYGCDPACVVSAKPWTLTNGDLGSPSL